MIDIRNEKIRYAIAAAVVIVLAVGIFLFDKTRKKQDFIPDHPITITPDQKTMLEKEIADYKDKISKSSNNSDRMGLYLAIGIDEEGLGKFEDAKNAFLKAAEEQPNSYLPWSDLASLYDQVGDNSKQQDAVKRALTLGPNDPLNWQKSIEFDRYKLKLSDSELRTEYANAFKATNDDLGLHRDFASYLEQMKAYSDELAQWQFIVSKNPSDQTAKSEVTRLQVLLKK